MLRVLHVIGAMNRAGAETFIMNVYRAMDKEQVQFDFLVHAQGRSDYDDEIEELGGRIFHIPRYNVLNKKAYTQAVRKVLQEHPEDAIVHSHIGSSAPVNLACAHEEGRTTIAHSHRQTNIDSLQNLAFHLLSTPVRGKADWYMACSDEAALSRFGQDIFQSDACMIVRNGIDVESYGRDAVSVAAAKELLDVCGGPVYGHIGRFALEKNHEFLLATFKGILQEQPDAILLLVGTGNRQEHIERLAHDEGLDEHVRFLGLREDIPEVLRAMDVFLFPSHHEGLGIALVEAQAAGLECIASTGVPEAAIFTDRAQRLPLDSAQRWSQEALSACERSKNHDGSCIAEARAAGYDIQRTADELQRFYLEHA